MTKALIVYGTRYGAAASTVEEIAKILRQEELDVRVINAKQEKIKTANGQDLVIVGSGIQVDRWTGEPESFLKKLQKKLSEKKVTMFVCCGSASQALNKEDTATAERAKWSLGRATVGVQVGAVGLPRTA